MATSGRRGDLGAEPGVEAGAAEARRLHDEVADEGPVDGVLDGGRQGRAEHREGADDADADEQGGRRAGGAPRVALRAAAGQSPGDASEGEGPAEQLRERTGEGGAEQDGAGEEEQRTQPGRGQGRLGVGGHGHRAGTGQRCEHADGDPPARGAAVLECGRPHGGDGRDPARLDRRRQAGEEAQPHADADRPRQRGSGDDEVVRRQPGVGGVEQGADAAGQPDAGEGTETGADDADQRRFEQRGREHLPP